MSSSAVTNSFQYGVFAQGKCEFVFTTLEQICEWLSDVRRPPQAFMEMVHFAVAVQNTVNCDGQILSVAPVLLTHLTGLKQNPVVLFHDDLGLRAINMCSLFFDCCSGDSLQIL